MHLLFCLILCAGGSFLMKKKIFLLLTLILLSTLITFSKVSPLKEKLQSEQSNYYCAIRNLYIQEYSMSMFKFRNILTVYSKLENEEDTLYLKGLIDSYFLNNSRMVYSAVSHYNNSHSTLVSSKDIHEQITINLEEIEKFLKTIKDINDIKKIDKNKYTKINILAENLTPTGLGTSLKDEEYLLLLREFENEILSLSKK